MEISSGNGPSAEHFDELGFDEAAKNVLFRDPNLRTSDGGVGDYLHVNCMSYLGANDGMTREICVLSGEHYF